MSRQILAIDIRNNSIAAVVLNAGLKSHSVESCAHILLPEAENRLGEGLAALKLSGIPDNPTVVVSLPADRAIFRTVFVPFKEEKKIRQVLPFELEPNLPVAVDDLVIDYQKSADPENDGLLTTAIDRGYLEQILAELSAAGLRPQLVVPGGVPLALGLIGYHQIEDQGLVLDVGPRRTTLIALKDKKVALLRSMASDTSSETALEALSLRIRQTLTAFADSQPGGFSPQSLYMSGSALIDEGTAARVAGALNMPLKTVDLRSVAPKLDVVTPPAQWKPFLFDSALALALIEAEGRPCINFHRSTSTIRKFWTNHRPFLQVPAVLLGLVLLLGLAGVLIETHMLNKRVDRINAEIKSLFTSTFPNSRLINVDNALNQMKSEMKTARGNIDAGHDVSQVRTIDILLQLSQLIPGEIDVVMSRLVSGSDGITISGEAAAFQVVDDIKSRLEKSDLFKQVTIASANMDRAGNKVQFRLKIDLN
jgi:general secretion pathway protein L